VRCSLCVLPQQKRTIWLTGKAGRVISATDPFSVVALALSILPPEVPQREEIIRIEFAAVAFPVFVQGLSISSFLAGWERSHANPVEMDCAILGVVKVAAIIFWNHTVPSARISHAEKYLESGDRGGSHHFPVLFKSLDGGI